MSFWTTRNFLGWDAVNRALRPYWPVLWRLAARGHYCLTQEPLRAKSMSQDSFLSAADPIHQGGGIHSLVQSRRGRRHFPAIEFPRFARRDVPPVNGYPKITEFPSHACGTRSRQPKAPLGRGALPGLCCSLRGKAGARITGSRAHQNGITFGLSEKEWKSVHSLFRRAWELSEIRMAWTR